MQVKPVLTLPISPGTAQTMADVEFSACPVWVKLRRTQNEQMSSGLALKADIALCSRHVSKVPIGDICSAANCSLFDHLIGAGEQRCWYFKPERFRGLQVDH